MKKKKVLFHLPVTLSPLNSGAKRRIIGILNYFKENKEFYDLDAVSSNEFRKKIWGSEQKSDVLNFANHFFVYKSENNVLDFLYSRSKSLYYQKLLKQQLYVDSDYFTPPGYVKFVKNLVKQYSYDYIWINYLDYAHLGLDVKENSLNCIIDMHDLICNMRLARKNVPHLKGLRFDYQSNFTREVNLLSKFDAIIANSQDELELISPYISSSKLHLIPHMVAEANSELKVTPYSSRSFKYDLLFVGAQYQPNIDGINFFLNSIFPQVLDKRPETRLLIVGTVTQSIEVNPSLRPNVECLEYVPDLSEIYSHSRLVICPLLDGSGTKVKLLEAISYAIPIIITTVGASGLSLSHEVNALITNEPIIYAQHIIRLLLEPQTAQKFSEQVALTFENNYSSRVVSSKLDRVFNINY